MTGQAGGTSGPTTLDVRYAYDTFNRLVSRTVYDPATNRPLLGDKYIYDGDHVVMDFAAAGMAESTLSKRFLYGPAVDQILAQEDVTQDISAAGRVLWFLGDNQNTTRDLVNNVGATVTGGHFTYDAFGHVTGGDTTLTNDLYTGRYLDPLTGLQYNRARWYDPGTGRWISQDPIGFKAGDANLYRYVGNSPTNGTDPQGMDWLDSYANSFNRVCGSFGSGYSNTVGGAIASAVSAVPGGDQALANASANQLAIITTGGVAIVVGGGWLGIGALGGGGAAAGGAGAAGIGGEGAALCGLSPGVASHVWNIETLLGEMAAIEAAIEANPLYSVSGNAEIAQLQELLNFILRN